MKTNNRLLLSTSPPTQPARKLRRTASLALRQRRLYGRSWRNFTGKELDMETGLYYYGARYLDPKISRWLNGDPAVGEYVPSAPASDEARKQNQNLPGTGGVFNYVNLHVYHYGGNNPVRYVDPDGRIQVDSNNGILFWPNRNQDGERIVERVQGNTGLMIDVVYGYIKANDGTRIQARENLSNVRAENFDCHGYTFTNGAFWINNTEVANLLRGDGYRKVGIPRKGDILIKKDSNGEITHSAIVKSVDLRKREVTVTEAAGVAVFMADDGNRYDIREHIYRIDGTDGIFEFYARPPNRVME